VVLEGRGRFVNRPTQTGGKKYDKFFIYVPTELAKDSQFPFKDGDELVLKLVVNRKKSVIEVSIA
jgi:hypothetical protein